MADKYDESERSARGAFDDLVATWRSEILPDTGGGVLDDGFIDIEEIREDNPARGTITKGKRRPPTSGGTGGGEFDIAGSTVTKARLLFALMIKRAGTPGPQEYFGSVVEGTGAGGGRATFVRRAEREKDDGQEQGTWIATKGG